MKNVPMRFCGYTFHHNPATLTVEHDSSIRELSSPFRETENELIGTRLRRISGEGELYGADCIAQFRELQKLFSDSRQGLLSLPHMPAMTAWLKELKMIAEPRDNVLTYRFVFVEARMPKRDTLTDNIYETLVEGESLWDISYKKGVPIDTLVMLNPQIRYIGYLEAGERVHLC